jgi:hypothetical protein
MPTVRQPLKLNSLFARWAFADEQREVLILMPDGRVRTVGEVLDDQNPPQPGGRPVSRQSSERT